MKLKLIAGFLVAASAMFAGPRISVGIGFGVPAPGYYLPPAPVYAAPPAAYYPPAPVYAAPAYIPPAPGPGYNWIAGYWYFSGGRRLWRPGYWAAPYAHVYAGSRWYRR